MKNSKKGRKNIRKSSRVIQINVFLSAERLLFITYHLLTICNARASLLLVGHEHETMSRGTKCDNIWEMGGKNSTRCKSSFGKRTPPMKEFFQSLIFWKKLHLPYQINPL